jgi:hypothetical protein
VHRPGLSLVLVILGACGSNGQTAPPIVVGDCAGLGEVGEWQQITPPGIAMVMAPGDKLAAFAFAVDPVSSGTVYFGTAYQHMWKTTDCGASWIDAGQGRNGDAWNHAMNWTFVVDPIEPTTVYTNTGYGNKSNGLYKSVNSGADWDPVWPPATQPELATHLQYQFANVVAMDPADHEHLLLTFHETCTLGNATTCIAETHDGGATWSLIEGEADWNGGEGQIIYFLDGPQTWLWGSQTNGFYRTENGGASWTKLMAAMGTFNTSHLQGSGMYRIADGTFFLASSEGLFRSTDGKVWSLIANTGPIGGGVVGDGTTMFYSKCYFGDFCMAGTDFLLTSPESDGMTWTPLTSPAMNQGGSLGYDRGHDLLYSSNGSSGFWRVRTK